MPNVLSRLPLLAVAACALACLLAGSSGGTPIARAARPKVVHRVLRPHPPKRGVRKHRHHERTLGQRAARIALEAVGVPYHWGGSSPSGGFDCSGLVSWAYGRLGVDLSHSSYALAGMGRRIGRSHLRPGDLLFFYGF